MEQLLNKTTKRNTETQLLERSRGGEKTWMILEFWKTIPERFLLHLHKHTALSSTISGSAGAQDSNCWTTGAHLTITPASGLVHVMQSTCRGHLSPRPTHWHRRQTLHFLSKQRLNYSDQAQKPKVFKRPQDPRYLTNSAGLVASLLCVLPKVLAKHTC